MIEASFSKITLIALKTLGEMIKLARTDRALSQDNLAKRLNVSRHTVIALEKGNPKVSIGVVFEAATIVGLPLLAESETELRKLQKITAGFNAILPKKVRTKKERLDDDF